MTLDIATARAHLASYDETCETYREAQGPDDEFDDDQSSVKDYENYEDGLTGVVHDLATALREALAEIESLSPPEAIGPFPMPAEGAVEDGDVVRCPHVDDTGEVCGGVMELIERVWDYRNITWRESDFNHTIVLGITDGNYGDGEHWSFECNTGHVYDLPDPDRVEYI